MVGTLAFWLVLAQVEVVGEGACPAPADVSRRLAELVPVAAVPAAPRMARLSRVGDSLRVVLAGADGQRLGERDLPANESCADLAAAVAVVIAAWEAQIDPRVTSRVDLPAPAAPVTAPVLAVQAKPAPPRPGPAFDLGLGLIASLTGGQLAPGARLGAWIAPAGWRIGIGVAAAATTARAEPVAPPPAAARWTRLAFGLGPETRFGAGQTTVGARLHALAALLQVEGVGLPTTASDSSAQFGAGMGLHIGRPWGNATPWIGADVLIWPGRERLVITGVSAQGELPRFEVQLAIGLSLGRLP
jgi:hypothetical protein